MVTAAHIVNWIIVVSFIICFAYQIVYLFVPYFKKAKRMPDGKPHDFAVLIAARNEEPVIAQLIDSIQKQTYQDGRTDIFVVADNCTDQTARAAREAGANVVERHNRTKIGKGYALQYLLKHIMKKKFFQNYDGFFVFDADNLLEENFIEEMNKVFSNGYQVVTSYRNSKNFGDNWITSGYGLWFLHEAQFLNRGRMTSGNSCMVSGTGYLVSREILEETNGWNFFLLTEDIEFTADCILKKVRMGYCSQAVFYDEQPTKFSESWHQRIRWIKGYFQVYRKYGKELLHGIGREGGFSCFDMLMTSLPAFVLTAFATAASLFMTLLGLLTAQDISFVLFSIGMFFVKTSAAMFVLGIYTMLTEWKMIHMPLRKKIIGIFTFPLFMNTFIPIAFASLRRKVEWKPISHNCHMSLKQVKQVKKMVS